MTTIQTIPKGMKDIFSRNSGGGGDVNHNTPSVCMLSKGRNSNIFVAVSCVQLKIIGLVVGDVEPTKENICILMLLLKLIPILLVLLLLLLLLVRPLRLRLQRLILLLLLELKILR